MTAVLVTRPAGRGDRLVAVLRAHGLRVHAVPTVAVAPLADTSELDRAIRSIATSLVSSLRSASASSPFDCACSSVRNTRRIFTTAISGPTMLQ